MIVNTGTQRFAEYWVLATATTHAGWLAALFRTGSSKQLQLKPVPNARIGKLFQNLNAAGIYIYLQHHCPLAETLISPLKIPSPLNVFEDSKRTLFTFYSTKRNKTGSSGTLSWEAPNRPAATLRPSSASTVISNTGNQNQNCVLHEVLTRTFPSSIHPYQVLEKPLPMKCGINNI